MLAYLADEYCDMSRRSARIIGGIGRTFIGAGILVMAFAIFQLWGTGIQEERAQGNLTSEFEAQLALVNQLAAQVDAAQVDAPTEPEQDFFGASSDELAAPVQPQSQNQIPKAPVIAPALAEALIPKAGDAMGRIEIPALDLSKAIVQGVRRAGLREPSLAGPGVALASKEPAGRAGRAWCRLLTESIRRCEPGTRLGLDAFSMTCLVNSMSRSMSNEPDGGR